MTSLAALGSADPHPLAVGAFLLLGLGLFVGGTYFVFGYVRMEIDDSHRVILVRTNFLGFSKTETLGFQEVREVGVKEAYVSGSPTAESGTSYAAEIRGTRDVEVPGSRGSKSETAVGIGVEIADRIGARFNPDFRRQVTGSFKLG